MSRAHAAVVIPTPRSRSQWLRPPHPALRATFSPPGRRRDASAAADGRAAAVIAPAGAASGGFMTGAGGGLSPASPQRGEDARRADEGALCDGRFFPGRCIPMSASWVNVSGACRHGYPHAAVVIPMPRSRSQWLRPLIRRYAPPLPTLRFDSGRSTGDAERQKRKKRPLPAASDPDSKPYAQMFVISTLRSLSNSSSISSLEMISGGDSAMMSPVVRISRPDS
jgi:hypothetical protein